LEKFHEAVVDSGVAEVMAIWYVNWAQKFATSFRGKAAALTFGRGCILDIMIAVPPRDWIN